MLGWFIVGAGVVSLAAALWAMSAPYGYEDEEGFHRGDPPEDDRDDAP